MQQKQVGSKGIVGYYELMYTKPGCTFCPDNHLLKGDVIASVDGGYLISALSSPHRYLIVPERHAETIAELPDNWLQVIKTLLPQIPGLPLAYNLSFNIGKQAGQTLSHLHLWVIPRESGEASTGKGLATLIDKVNQSA